MPISGYQVGAICSCSALRTYGYAPLLDRSDSPIAFICYLSHVRNLDLDLRLGVNGMVVVQHISGVSLVETAGISRWPELRFTSARSSRVAGKCKTDADFSLRACGLRIFLAL